VLIQSSIKLHPTIKTLSKYIVYTHLHIGLSAAFITFGTAYHATITNYLLYGITAFFATISVYNFHGVYKAQQLKSSAKHTWICGHQLYVNWLIAVSTSITLLLLMFLLKKPFIVLPLLFVIGFVSYYYVIPIKGSPLREQPFMKVIYVAATWTSFLLIFPSLNEGIIALHWGEICAYFCLFVAIALPYDIRDVSIDQQKFKTLPSSIGSQKTMLISVSAYLISGTLILSTDRTTIYNPIFWGVFGSNVLLLLAVFYRKKEPYFELLDSAFGMIGLIYFW
jgi:4-hydroxybenzoate polyprenyltransferase